MLTRIADGTERAPEPDTELGGGADFSTVHDDETESVQIDQETGELGSVTKMALPGSSTSCGDKDSASYGCRGVETVYRHSTSSEAVDDQALSRSDSIGLRPCNDAEVALPVGELRAEADSVSVEELVNTPIAKQNEDYPIKRTSAPLSCDHPLNSSIGQHISTVDLDKGKHTIIPEKDKLSSTASWSGWNEIPSALLAAGVASLCIAGTMWVSDSALTWMRQEEDTEDG